MKKAGESIREFIADILLICSIMMISLVSVFMYEVMPILVKDLGDYLSILLVILTFYTFVIISLILLNIRRRFINHDAKVGEDEA